MTSPMYDSLRAVPPQINIKTRMSWLLQLRRAARRALDAALAAPRAAAQYLGRLPHSLCLKGALVFMQARMARFAAPFVALGHWLGRGGLVAALAAVVSSDTGRAILSKGGRAVGRAVSWWGKTAYGLVDQGLRCLGRPGHTVADLLFAATVRFGGRLAAVAAPVVHQVARLSDPASPLMRLVSGLSRSYLLHRLVKGLINNRLLRLVLEALLVPAVADSRLVLWLRGLVRQARVRMEALRHQEAAVDVLPVDEEIAEELLEDLALPTPSNRAERRAAQRQGRRQQ